MLCHALVYMSHECTIELRNFLERHRSLHFVLNVWSLSPTSMAGGACFRALLSVTTVIDMLYRALAHSRTHKHTHTYLGTGPCFMLYNGMLRGFGNCGEVPASEDVEYGSEEFWQLLAAKTVADRMKNAGHKFSSTMHALASAIKKIQGIAEDGQGTRLYRGLGKLLTQRF